MTTTELYQAMHAAKQKEEDCDYSILKLTHAAIDAENAWGAALQIARMTFEALPANKAADSAITNANETEDCDVDKLRWYEIALLTYDEMIQLPGYDK